MDLLLFYLPGNVLNTQMCTQFKKLKHVYLKTAFITTLNYVGDIKFILWAIAEGKHKVSLS